jgi:GntR family transcriptional regulator
VVDRTTGVALKHVQIREFLREAISRSEVGTPLPSERELVERFGVARMTVRQAVNRLVSEGRLYRVPARGTYVARPAIVLPVRLTSFSEDMASRGLVPGSVDLVRRTEPAKAAVADTLGIRAGEQVHVIERLRTADGEPMAIERAHLPADITPGLAQESLRDRSLYTVLEQRHGIVLDAGEQTISAATVTGGDAGLLAVPDGSPVLLLTRRSYASGRPVEHVVSVYRADRYQLRVALDLPANVRSGAGPPPTSGPRTPIRASLAPGASPGASPRTGVRP